MEPIIHWIKDGSNYVHNYTLLMVQKSQGQPPFGCIRPVVNKGIFTMSTGEFTGFFPSTLCLSSKTDSLILGKLGHQLATQKLEVA